MSNRGTVPRLATDPLQAISVLMEELADLRDRVARLEGRSGQALPPDYRFASGGAGEVVVERVTTGNTDAITGAL